MLKKILLFIVFTISLSACTTEENPESKEGVASITVTIPGLSSRSKARSTQRTGVPSEVTSLLIEVLDSQNTVLDAAEVIGTNGSVTLTIKAGKNYTIRGSAFAGSELLFRGESTIAEIKTGAKSSISLQLNEQVTLSLSALSDMPVGQGQSTVSFNLSGINDVQINWYVNNILGGNNTVGIISTQGIYTPPAMLPANTSIEIKAEPVVAPSFSQTFNFNLLPAVNNIPPFDMALSTSNYDPNVVTPFSLKITFPTAVTGFDQTDIVLTGAVVSSFNTSDNTVFNASILPTKKGTVTVNILANSAINNIGASNKASRQLRLPYFNWALIHPKPTPANLESIAIGGGRCVIAGSGGNVSEILSSPTNLQWQRSSFKPADANYNFIHDVQYTTLNGGTYLATAQDGFYSSTDTLNWTFNATNNVSGMKFTAITEGKDSNSSPLLVAVAASNNRLSKSSDGISWTDIDFSGVLQPNEFIDLYDVIWDSNQFVAVGSRYQFTSFSNNNHGSIILTSTDGINWSVAYRSFVSTSGFSNATYDFLLTVTIAPDGTDGLRWVAMGNKGVIVSSTDGINWSAAATTLGDTIRIESVTFSGNSIIAVGRDTNNFSSAPVAYRAYAYSNAPVLTWTQLTLPPGVTSSNLLKDIDVCQNQTTNSKVWLAVGDKGLILSSTDVSGLTWTQLNTSQFGEIITNYIEGKGLSLAETQNSSTHSLYRSSDGINWAGGFNENIIDLSYLNSTFFAITRDINIGNWSLKTSTDGLSWAEKYSVATIFPYPNHLLNISTIAGNIVWLLGTANNNSINLSTDGVNWLANNLTTPLQVPPTVNSANNLFISSINNQIVTSETGTEWTPLGTSFCGANCSFPAASQVLQFGERYVVLGATSSGEGGGGLIQLVYSDDNGQNWSSPLTLPGSCSSPVLSIESDLLTYSCGQLYVSIDAIEWVEVLAPFNNPKLKFTYSSYRLFGDNGSLMSDEAILNVVQ